MIDIRKLKELVRLMVSNDLTELVLRDSEEEVTLRRPGAHVPPTVMTAALPHAADATAPTESTARSTSTDDDSGNDDAADLSNLVAIASPMVGTFYAAANPDNDPFVSIGDRVSADTVVCLIEAMKIFNEIKAETAGVIERIAVRNGDSVEFGQPIIYVKPD